MSVELLQRDSGLWHARTRLEKYEGDIAEFDPVEFLRRRRPYEVIEDEGNLLVNAGINALEQLLAGTGSPTAFNAANAYIGVGDSSTAASAAQTDLQASSNKLRKAMDSTYPLQASQVMTWKATFASADANFAWAEWAVFNAAAAGTMLNRKVQDNGTKAAGSSWAFTVTVTIS